MFDGSTWTTLTTMASGRFNLWSGVVGDLLWHNAFLGTATLKGDGTEQLRVRTMAPATVGSYTGNLDELTLVKV